MDVLKCKIIIILMQSIYYLGCQKLNGQIVKIDWGAQKCLRRLNFYFYTNALLDRQLKESSWTQMNHESDKNKECLS